MRSICTAVSFVLLAASAFAQDARELFATNCASCHGETGDGKGTTQLDRPARSFKDGGFSYGNTPEALFRTITTGIPGTPMPSFESSLTVEQRRALAAYVVTLGPEVEAVDPEKTVMHVTDRPRVVRGLLPPIADGAVAQPRGLLVGTTDGFTFEYRADDVRLLGVRLGGFVDRKDWTGRGGTALEPLGQVVHLLEDGQPRATFASVGGGELRAKLAQTAVRDGGVDLHYALYDAAGTLHAQVTEAPFATGTSVGAGFTRVFELARTAPGEPVDLLVRVQVYGEARRVDSFRAAGREWTVRRLPDDRYEIVGVGAPAGTSYRQQGGVYDVVLPSGRVVVTTLVTADWSEELRGQLIAELER